MRYTYLVPVLMIVMSSGWAVAQDYSFQVPAMELRVFVNPDASVTMQYEIAFRCNEGAKPIDIVDIGVPHRGYDIKNMTAHLDGEQMYTIRRSEYVNPGVEVPLVNNIMPGETGIFEIELTMPEMVYQDTTRDDYASLRITPTWFDGQYQTGNTDLLIGVYLPKSINTDEMLYQMAEFSNKVELDNHNVAVWQFKDIRHTGPQMVGISFPKRDMERVVRMTKLGLVWKWWTDNPEARLIAGFIFLIFFGIFYYRFTGGTGTCLFIPLIIFMAIWWGFSPAMQALFVPLIIPAWYLSNKALAGKRRGYLPAIESVPGGEIKRGLAVPEAAVLIEQPLGRVMSLVIFGLMKKNLVRLVAENPLQVELVEGYDTTRSERRRVAQSRNTVIRGFEQPFLDEIAKNPDKPLEKMDFSKPMKELVESTARRVKGFDLEQTKEYYLSIVNKAWQEAQQIGELEQRDEFVDDNLLWLMMDPTYDRHFDTWHRGGYHYRPVWTRPAPSGGGAPAPQTPVGGRTSLGDVAASFAGWSEGVTGRLAASMDPVSVGLAERGVINLSGVDKVGMTMLESSGSSSSGGGGCACACAGCACACACAGGGR